MTDKELLELAAKAAGIEVTVYDWQMGCRVIDGGVYKDWNPLTDDGDALRLAVKLGIDLNFGTTAVFATDHRYGSRESFIGDPYTATRRAIVRAAAEIGKGMK